MAYNGSGTFVINSSGQPVVTGTVISSTAFNALTADLATGLSTAITKDGQTTTTARITFAQGVSSTLVTDATSATTGSIITAGGISTQKALWVGTTTTLAGALTYGGVTLSNAVTGTGNMVLATSPTLTTPILGVAAGTSLALGGATIGSNALAVTGKGTFSTAIQATGSATFASGVGLELGYDGTYAYVSAYNRNTTAYAPLSLNGSVIDVLPGGVFAARFDTSGNLLVGTTTTGGWSGAAKFETKGGSFTVSAYNTSSSLSNCAFLGRVDNTSVYLARFLYTSATDVGSIQTNGTTTSYVTTSDYRLKENVQPITGGLVTVAALKPVTYDWISNGSTGEGFIAHELQAIIPEAVRGDKDAVTEDGSILPQGVDFGKIVPHLVAAIQELTTRLAALENK